MLRSTRLTCWLVDDGSHAPCAHAVQALCLDNPQWLRRLRLETNQGKGAAVLAGMRAALAAGFTHAVQIDADLQHDPSRIGDFISAAERNPSAVINGVPQYDASVPAVRLHGRHILPCGRVHTIAQDRRAMCGFRLIIESLVALVNEFASAPYGVRRGSCAALLAGTPLVNLSTR